MSFFLYNKKNITRRLEEWILFSRGIKTIFYSLPALVRKILFCHWKIKFRSSRHRVISSIYAANESTLIFLTKTYVRALNFLTGINPLTFRSLDLRDTVMSRLPLDSPKSQLSCNLYKTISIEIVEEWRAKYTTNKKKFPNKTLKNEAICINRLFFGRYCFLVTLCPGSLIALR